MRIWATSDKSLLNKLEINKNIFYQILDSSSRSQFVIKEMCDPITNEREVPNFPNNLLLFALLNEKKFLGTKSTR